MLNSPTGVSHLDQFHWITFSNCLWYNTVGRIPANPHPRISHNTKRFLESQLLPMVHQATFENCGRGCGFCGRFETAPECCLNLFRAFLLVHAPQHEARSLFWSRTRTPFLFLLRSSFLLSCFFVPTRPVINIYVDLLSSGHRPVEQSQKRLPSPRQPPLFTNVRTYCANLFPSSWNVDKMDLYVHTYTKVCEKFQIRLIFLILSPPPLSFNKHSKPKITKHKQSNGIKDTRTKKLNDPPWS